MKKLPGYWYIPNAFICLCLCNLHEVDLFVDPVVVVGRCIKSLRKVVASSLTLLLHMLIVKVK